MKNAATSITMNVKKNSFLMILFDCNALSKEGAAVDILDLYIICKLYPMARINHSAMISINHKSSHYNLIGFIKELSKKHQSSRRRLAITPRPSSPKSIASGVVAGESGIEEQSDPDDLSDGDSSGLVGWSGLVG